MIKTLDVALVIAFFGSHNSSVKGRTRVQKGVCILKHNDKIPFNFVFEPYYYGPYSSELTDTIDTLVAAGLLEQTIVLLSSGIRRYDYKLTEEGRELFRKVKKALNRKAPETYMKLNNRTKKLREMPIYKVITLAKKCSGIQSTI